jgi:carboxyl-terminal processing protease
VPKKAIKITGITLLSLFIAAIVFAGGFMIGERAVYNSFYSAHVPTTGNAATFSTLEEIYNTVVSQYVTVPNKAKLVDGAINGLLAALNDTHTQHFSKADFQHVNEVTQGRFEGVGMTLEQTNGQLTIVSPIEGTPASKAGLKAGDKIMAINGKPTKGMTLDNAVSSIKGKSGTKVTLSIVTGDAPARDVTLVRAEIRVPNISSHMEGSVGYVRLIHSFDSTAGPDVRREIIKLKGQGAKAIIFDLRNNPGGLLLSGVDVASSFIDKGVIVSIRERSKAEQKYTATGSADATIPMCVLVNKGSASASEIVAGAIQDYGRGPIIGEQSYGKGSVQTVIDLADGSGLIMTTAKYYTPKGRSIDKVGVTPDIKVVQPDGSATDLQLNKAIEVMNFILGGGDWKTLKN